MAESADSEWDALFADDFTVVAVDEDERINRQNKILNEETRRSTTAIAKKTAAANDYLGLLRQNSNDETVPSSYEPSLSSRGAGPNASRRQNVKRHSITQQQRAPRSENLLFSDDDDDAADKPNAARGGVYDLLADTPNRGNSSNRTLATPTIMTTAAVDGGGDTADRLSKRRETSPSISTAKTTVAEKTMPSWFREITQQKTEIPPTTIIAGPSPSPPAMSSAKETVPATASVRKSETAGREKTAEDEPTSSVISLLRGKDSLQSTILELIQELSKKKQDIQQATLTLIQNQQNSDLLIRALLMDNNSSVMNPDGQELERLRSENHKFQLTVDHLSKKHELELDALKTKYELQQNVLHEKLDRLEERINELEEERKADGTEQKENEKRLKEMYEDRLRTMHESHLIDLKQSVEVQKIKMNHLEEVECSLRDAKPKRLSSEEMTAKEMSISAQENKLKELQEEVDKQMAELEGERSALQMKIDEFQSRNQRERNEIELAGKELKRSTKAFEDGRKTWEREKKSETQYIESRKQELEAVRSSVMEEQRKLSEERYEVASERYRLESMLKLDTGTGTDLIQAKVEVKENFKELRKKENELEKRLEQVKEMETRLAEEKRKIQEQDDEIKMKSIRAEKMLKIAISKQEEGLKALESAKDIQNKFDKKGKDIQNRLLDIIMREENIVQEETKLAKEKDIFDKQRKKLDLVLPQLSADEIRFFNPKPNKYEAEKEVYYKKNHLY